jgi:hypothetical protein
MRTWDGFRTVARKYAAVVMDREGCGNSGLWRSIATRVLRPPPVSQAELLRVLRPLLPPNREGETAASLKQALVTAFGPAGALEKGQFKVLIAAVTAECAAERAHAQRQRT